VTRLGNHERLADAHDTLRLPQDRLDAAWILVFARDLARTLRRLKILKPHDAPFRLRHRLLCEDDDVAVLERELRGDQRGEVVPFIDLGQPFDCNNPDFFQGRPVILMPACAL
jgi:hypothetical protein